jgi:hypothetical protein
MARNPKTSRVRARVGDRNLRLTGADRQFLADLAQARLVDESTAARWHYSDRKSGASRPLERLTRAGVLQRYSIVDPSRGQTINVYGFRDGRIARMWGGRAPSIGRQRQVYHELMVGRLYFEAGRPESWRTDQEFDRADYERFGQAPPGFSQGATHHAVAGDGALPDALYTDADGQVVAVEADSGHYTSRQINHKQQLWRGCRQLWGQPTQPHAAVPRGAGVQVAQF